MHRFHPFLSGDPPLVCGGADSRHCRSYDFKENVWSVVANLSNVRGNSASSVHPSLGLVVTGGYPDVKAVEAVAADHKVSELMPLPFGVYDHCQV